MPAETQSEPRVNILLPTPLFDRPEVAPLTRGGPSNAWSVEQYREARARLADFEGMEVLNEGADPSAVRDVLQALAKHPSAQTSLMAAMMSPATDLSSQDIPYVSLDDLQGVGPPEGLPLHVPEIGLISVPAPTEPGAAVEMVTEAVSDVRPGIRVEPEVIVRAIEMMLDDPTLPPVAQPLMDGMEAEPQWLEAALDTGALAETLPWGIARVDAPRAWARGYRGQGIRVAIVDSGVGPHIELPPPVASQTFVPGTTSANDDHGHGTHVAGTVMARQNGVGVVGVAPLAQLIRAKVLNSAGSGSDAQVAAGIVWAVNNGARIINLSLGSSAFSATIQRALVFARLRRVAVFAAAGNDSTPTICRPVGYPARDPLCIAIAATDILNKKAPFSNCGPELDLSGPGVNILSTFPPNSYRVLNGTSMATPHAAGVGAVALSRYPGLDPVRLQNHLQRTAIGLGPVNRFGRGLVQAGAAVLTTPLALEDGLAAPSADGGTAAARPSERSRQAARAGSN